MKLFPLIAQAFAMAISAEHIRQLYYQMMNDVKIQKFTILDVLHHFCSGMKSLYTQQVTDGLYVVRQSIGGAGFSAWSGIPRIIEDYAPQVTFEGDNTVMAHQCTNYLLKQAKKANQGKSRTKLDGAFTYLSELDALKTKRCSASGAAHFLNLEILDEALKVNAAYLLDRMLKTFKDNENVPKKDLNNLMYGEDLVELSNAHIRYVTFWNFRQRLEKGDLKCPNNVANLTNLCRLYGLWSIRHNCTPIFEAGYFSSGLPVGSWILEAIKIVLKELRPQMVNIVETAFPASDEGLQSAVGNSYGDIYETHLRWAKEGRMNQTKDAIPEGFLKYMTPILQAKL